MKVYLVKAGEWEREDLAKEKCLEIAKQYGVEDDYEDMISYTEYEFYE